MKRGPIFATVIFVTLCVLATFAAAATTEQPTVIYIPLKTSTAPAAVPEKEHPAWIEPGLYLSGQIGAFGPSDDKYEVYQPDDGIAGNLLFGYRINPFVCIQGEFGYYGYDGLSQFNFYGVPIMGSIRLGMPLYNFDIYTTGGVGAIVYKAEDYSSTTDGVAVATFIGLGSNFYINDSFFVGAELRYYMTEVSSAPNDGMGVYAQIGWKY